MHIVLLLFLVFFLPHPAAAEDLALVGGRLLDGYGGPPLEDAVILISGNKITAVGGVGTLDVPSGARVIDTNGMTVMPGLINLHVHFDILGHNDYPHWFSTYQKRLPELMPVAARIMLESGVTSVRDLGANVDNIFKLRADINSGKIPGPRTFIVGPFLRKVSPDTGGGYSTGDTYVVDGPEDARNKVRKLIEMQVDFIKTQDDDLSRAELDAIIDEAHRGGKHVASHVFSPEAVLNVLRAGLDGGDTIEHISYGPMTAYNDETVYLITSREVKMSPTIIAVEGFLLLEQFPEYRDDPQFKAGLPPDIWRDVRASYENFQSHPLFYRAKWEYEGRRAKLRQLYRAGARFILGSDSGTRGNPHHSSAWREMELLTEIGLSNMESIMAATYDAARVLGKASEIGTVEPGKLADVIVVDGDPLTDISSMRHVVHVVKDGVVYK
jgi:imidazolonepropionase-like amidohydrolase